jgi:diaminopimelate epimerase
MRIFNADGSEAEMCGNGARCIAQFAYSLGIQNSILKIETLGGLVKSIREEGETIRINMGKPHDVRAHFLTKIGDTSHEVFFMNTGVPHAIIFIKNIESIPVKEWGGIVRHLPEFQAQGSNCNFVEVIDSHNIKVRTYERGVEDETFSCGTGTCASAIASVMHKGLEWPIQSKNLQNEVLTIDSSITQSNHSCDFFLIGNVHTSFEGQIVL